MTPPPPPLPLLPLAVPGRTMPGSAIVTADSRDLQFSSRMAAQTPASQLPASWTVVPDLSALPPVRDQGAAGMCVAYACAAARGVHALRQQGVRYHLSPQYVYERRANAPGDGMAPRDALGVLRTFGTCPERDCPALTATAQAGDADAACVGSAAMDDRAVPFRIDSYWQVRTPDEARVALHDVGPIVISAPVYSTGPQPWAPVAGVAPNYHCMCLVGYDDAAGTLLVRNSWGTSWAQGGYSSMPYATLAGCYCSVMVPAAPALPDPLAPPPDPLAPPPAPAAPAPASAPRRPQPLAPRGPAAVPAPVFRRSDDVQALGARGAWAVWLLLLGAVLALLAAVALAFSVAASRAGAGAGEGAGGAA